MIHAFKRELNDLKDFLILIDRYRSEYATFRDLLAHKVCLQTATEIAGMVGAFADKEDVV